MNIYKNTKKYTYGRKKIQTFTVAPIKKKSSEMGTEATTYVYLWVAYAACESVSLGIYSSVGVASLEFAYASQTHISSKGEEALKSATCSRDFCALESFHPGKYFPPSPSILWDEKLNLLSPFSCVLYGHYTWQDSPKLFRYKIMLAPRPCRRKET